MAEKLKTIRLSKANHRTLRLLQKSAPLKVSLQELCNAAIGLGAIQLDIYKKDKNHARKKTT